MIVPGLFDAGLLEKLSQIPALDVEAAPAVKQIPEPQKPGKVPTFEADVFESDLSAILTGQAAAVSLGNRFEFGAIKLSASKSQTTYRRLSITPRPKPSTTLAHSNAEAWLNLDRLTLVDPIRDFLDRRPPLLLPPMRPVPPQRAVHVVSNDIVANGPALLLLCDATSLVSATVVANELESTAETGAAYLRQVDTTVFASNRCECLSEVNVVVVRSGEAQVSITGNAIVGAEPTVPPSPPLPPLRPPTKPGSIAGGTKQPGLADGGAVYPGKSPGGLHLAIDLGTGTEVKIPLNDDAIRKALDQTRDSGFSKVAEDAEAEFTHFASRSKWTPDPDAVDYFKGTLAMERIGVVSKESAFTLASKSRELSEPPADSEETADAGTSDREVTARPVTASSTPEAASPRLLSEADLGKETAAIESFNLFLDDNALTPATKLYGIYRATGKSELEAKNSVKVHLAANAGDDQGALIDGLRTVTGIETEKPTVKDQIKRASLLEDIVSVAIARPDILEVAPDVFEPRPRPVEPPPDPRDHSLVIIGGSRVGAINNVTTAGVHVHNADQSIENNL